MNSDISMKNSIAQHTLILLTYLVLISQSKLVLALGYENELADEANSTNVKTTKSQAAKSQNSKPGKSKPGASVAKQNPQKKSTTAPSIDSVEDRKKYMESIMANPDDFELDNVSTVSTSNIKSSTTATKKNNTEKINWDFKQQRNETLQPRLSRKQFEKNLQANYFVAFALYSKLDPVAKNMVYQSYLKKPDIDSVTKTIGDLSK